MPDMNPRPVMPRRFSDVMVDICGPLPESEGMRYLMTMVDRTSRFLEAAPLPAATAANCCKAFEDYWIRTFGYPDLVTCDNGNTFTSRLWKDINDNLGTFVSYTPVYSPASLGSLERQHLDLKSSLKATLIQMGEECIFLDLCLWQISLEKKKIKM